MLITGAAGSIGTAVRRNLAGPLRLVDTAAPPPGETLDWQQVSITDLAAMRAACRGVESIVHLAALADEDSWERILTINVDGTRTVLEAARLEGVRRVILASSIHAAGFLPRPDDGGRPPVPAGVAPRPDTHYGFSKAALEALGSLYHSRTGMAVICLRIGDFNPRPDPWLSSAWLSPGDCIRLIRAALTADGFHMVWGISRNATRWLDLSAGEAIGYHPQDSAPHSGATEADHLGGAYCTVPLGTPVGD
ncbi:NAD(P)-dependent oxidoreductase [Kribbella sandramycini]|uniref:NAD(P)-dependent oxidoreductase n=1 Tax=Kribbella sandramycini TaxID=60450 RepID=A0A7Y4KYK3_9ACTN|nr:NAD(P)-dependent oxidoreductase [Kribbella sandramycini]